MSHHPPSLATRAFERILLVKPSSLGDVLHGLPVLCGLRRRYPDARIDWLIAPPFAPLIENHPDITFKGDEIDVLSKNEVGVTGDLTIRGVTQKATLDVNYLGQWGTPLWVDGKDQGPKTRAGFLATTTINRNEFGVSWNGDMENGGVVLGNKVLITIDVEALLED